MSLFSRDTQAEHHLEYRPVPPIDAHAPVPTVTATFAAG